MTARRALWTGIALVTGFALGILSATRRAPDTTRPVDWQPAAAAAVQSDVDGPTGATAPPPSLPVYDELIQALRDLARVHAQCIRELDMDKAERAYAQGGHHMQLRLVLQRLAPAV